MLVAAGSTTYAHDLAAPLSQVLSDGSTSYLYGHERLAALGQSWYVGDALGSVRQTLDGTGSVLAIPAQAGTGYDPWGVPQYGMLAPFGFTGELHAQERVYLRARWYAPGNGTLTSRDPFAGWPEQPYSLHPYQDAGSNPVNWSDPSGECYGPFRSFRNVEFTKCRDLDKAMAIWYAPHATVSQKALAFAYISTWSFGAVAGVAAVPVTAAAAATTVGAGSGAVAVGASFGAAFDLIAQRVTQGSWSRVDGLQTVFSASTGVFGTGVGSVTQQAFKRSFWGRMVVDSIGSGLVGTGMTYLNNLFSCASTDLGEAFIWSAVLGGAGSGIGHRLEAASLARSKRLTLAPELFGSPADRKIALLALGMRDFQVADVPSFSVGVGTVMGNSVANAAPLGQVIEFIISPDEEFDPTDAPAPSSHSTTPVGIGTRAASVETHSWRGHT